MLSRCTKCKQVKDEKEFWPREDRTGLYSWCVDCCTENGRSQEYPPIKERGDGVIHPNYSSLRVGYNDGTV